MMRMLMLMVVISGLTAGAVFAGQNSHAVMADNEGGPILVTGQWNYKNFIIPTQYLEPVVILMDVSRPIQGNYTDFVPRTGQIIGQLTSSFSSPPVDYQVMVPRKPTGQYVDLDNNGHKNTGIQIFAITVGSNMVGDSYLEQLEQLSFSSFLADPHTAMIREGTFLIYAPDDQQGFPTSAGKDGQIFTTDDPTVSVSAGYTLVTLSADGSISFDRSKEAQMDTIEVVTFKSPDFSNQSILKSYNSLIDLLKQRYAYTELRQLDWEKIRQKYLPQVHKADAKDDMAGYYLELSKLAQSIHDSHVQVSATDAGIKMAPYLKILAQTETNLGAQVVKLSDERFIVTFLDPKGPAKKAGWEFGTEILSVDGISMKKRMETLLYTSSESTSEGLLNARLPHALSFPAGKPVTIKFRLSGENEIRSATLTAGKQFQTKSVYYEEREEISFKKLEHDYGYIQWDAFHDPLYELAVWEKFLSTFNYSSGIIIDLRGNIGGNVALLDTMASFLFTADNPAPFHWIDLYVFDEQVNDFVQSFASDYKLSAPKPELAYTGGVVVLVDGKSASAAEYFPQFLQQQGRAIVVGEHGTEGAGGYIDRVKLPGTMTFQFTKGRSVFAGTDEYNLEAKGVSLDIRVPITEENEKAKIEGRDPVLEAGIAALRAGENKRAVKRLVGRKWQWALTITLKGKKIKVLNPAKFTVQFIDDSTIQIQADCNRAMANYSLGKDNALTIHPGPATLAACPDSLGEDFMKYLGNVTTFNTGNDELLFMLKSDSGMMALELKAENTNK